jgi:glycine/D-amino acid oxidase-like deaminating enzyme
MGSRERIVICGGGAIGAAIAYFISLRGARPIVIERYEVGGAASGKSGGFLALDWSRVARWIDWRGVASSSMPSFRPSSAILGDIGG